MFIDRMNGIDRMEKGVGIQNKYIFLRSALGPALIPTNRTQANRPLSVLSVKSVVLCADRGTPAFLDGWAIACDL
jgi:hypothetical protein